MNVAITGGTGFVGRSLVMRHLALGDNVRVLSRKPRNETGFPDAVKVFSGDLGAAGNATLLAGFVEGADVVYHCAGEIANTDRMRTVHIDGTSNLVQAAKGNIGHWVQLSSVGAYGPYRYGEITEDTPVRPAGIYEATKAESDAVVQRAAEQGAFSCSVLRPSIVFGPGMRNRSLAQMAGMIARRLFFFIGPKGASANYIFVENVIEALVRCGRLESAKGRVYNLSDHRAIEQFVDLIADVLGSRRPSLRVPESAARFAARTIGKLPGFPLTESRVDALTTRAVYPATRIERELGYGHVVTMEDALSVVAGHWKAPA